jgi:AhpD family alkylhydroperoxidase
MCRSVGAEVTQRVAVVLGATGRLQMAAQPARRRGGHHGATVMVLETIPCKYSPMTRLSQIQPDDWDPELRQAVRPESRTPLENGLMRYFAHRPELAKGLMAFSGQLKRHRQLDSRLVELVRLRIAFHNQCRSCMAIRYTDAVEAGLNEDLVCSLERPADAPDLTDAEKVAIRFGELFATNHLAIDDALFDELRVHFTEGQIMELAMNVSLFVGVGRLGAVLHMVEELPEAFRSDGGTLAPWGNESIIVT